MQLPSTTKFVSIADYFKFENQAVDKHEYRAGEIRAMAGNSFRHSVIAVNIYAALHGRFKDKPCRVLDSNLRIGIPGTPLYTYPDASVVCGPVRMDPNDPEQRTVTNPRALIEILSPSTEAYDRGEKFTRYRKLESLADYILINQEMADVEIFHRQSDGTWLFSSASGLETQARIVGLQVEIPLSEIYAAVDFSASPGSETI